MTLTAKQKLHCELFFKRVIWHYLLAISSILICSWLFNRWLEGVAFCIAHTTLRYKFRYVYHNDNYCLLITNFIIWLCISQSRVLSVSLLSTLLEAFSVCWIGCIIQHKIIISKEVSVLRKELAPKPFNTDTCSKEELLIRCKQLRLSTSTTDLAVAFFIDKTKHSIIAENLCIEEKSVIMKKMRLKQKLNSGKSEIVDIL